MTLPFNETEYLIMQDAFEALIYDFEYGYADRDDYPYSTPDIKALRDKITNLSQTIIESTDR